MQLQIATWRFVFERIPNYKTALARSENSPVERAIRRASTLHYIAQQRDNAHRQMLLQGLGTQLR